MSHFQKRIYCEYCSSNSLYGNKIQKMNEDHSYVPPIKFFIINCRYSAKLSKEYYDFCTKYSKTGKLLISLTWCNFWMRDTNLMIFHQNPKFLKTWRVNFMQISIWVLLLSVLLYPKKKASVCHRLELIDSMHM